MPKDVEFCKITTSSNIDTLAYNPFSRTLLIKFLEGSVYVYQNVPLEIWRALLKANSKGEYANKFIYNKYVAQRLSEEEIIQRILCFG